MGVLAFGASRHIFGNLVYYYQKSALLLLIGLIGVPWVQSTVWASSVSVPIEELDAPADDLLYQGRPIDQDQAADLALSGVDLSTLEPSVSDVWGRKDRMLETSEVAYPPQGAVVRFGQTITTSKNIFRSRVFYGASPGESSIGPTLEEMEGRKLNDPAVAASAFSFQMSASLNSHTAMARNALLRKLGYAIPAPRYYKRLTVCFKDAQEKRNFLNTLSESTFTATTRWVVKGDLPNELTLQDMVLEPGQMVVPTYHWGELPLNHIKNRRTLRALIIPIVLMDIPESINLLSFEIGKVVSRAVFLTYSSAASFQTTTYSDARWITRKIASLTRQDFEAVLAEAAYPKDVTRLILEKVIARRNHLVQLFDLAGSMSTEQQRLPYQTSLNFGAVVKGKLTQVNYDGYAARFSYGDPKSPLRAEEMGRYVFMNVISSGIAAITASINQQLQINTTQDVLNAHQSNLIQKAIDWARQNPGDPYLQTTELWGGPVAGFSVRANRTVIAGPYYGSSAKVQVVDTIGVSGSAGVYAGVAPLPAAPMVVPSLNAAVTVQRSYIHVRPISDMKTALKQDWSELYVPKFIDRLAKLLEDPKYGDGGRTAAQKYTEFLDALEENEILMITDSTTVGARGEVSIPIPILMDPTVAIFNPSVRVGVGSFPTILKRTMITRTASGIQVYQQGAKVLNFEVELNLRWWMNIGRLYHEKRYADADTLAYLLDKGTASKNIDQLVSSMSAVLRGNSLEVLAENFDEYQIHHDMDLDIDKSKFLWHQSYRIREDHRVSIVPPGGNVAQTRTLFSNRLVENMGMNFYEFLGDILGALTRGIGSLPMYSGWNPSTSPLGFSTWTTITTEAEVTSKDSVAAPASTEPVSLVDTHFSGWILSKERLFEIIDLLELKVSSLGLGKSLIRRDEFSTTDHLELYDISSSLIVYAKGIDQMARDLFRPKTSEVISKLIEIEGHEDLKRWCDEGERQSINKITGQYTYYYREGGRDSMYRCLKPWMTQMLDLRAEVQSLESLDLESRVKWQNRLVKIASADLDFVKFLNWLGRDHYFYQIRINGFRSSDENGDTDYVSDSVGTFDPQQGTGPFREFSSRYGIMGYELYGRHLAEGYHGQ